MKQSQRHGGHLHIHSWVSPPAQPVVPPIFHDPFSPRPHWDASTPPGADSARCGSAWTLEEQRMSDSLSNSDYKVTTVAVAAVDALIFNHHDCGPRQLDHIWQARDGVGILRWNTVVTPDCHSMNTSRDSRKFKQPGS